MSTTGPFDTGYIGAHRWHVDEDRGYAWTCVCGDTGRAVGNLSFVLHEFARHAHDKLQEAAVSLLAPHLSVDSYDLLQDLVGMYRRQGDNDSANLLQIIANDHYRQEGGES